MRISSLCSKRISVLPRLRLFLKTHSVGAIAIPILTALAVQDVLKRQSEWFDVYVRAARLFLDGRDFYAAGVGYLYPPFQVLLAVPFLPLPNWAARAIWYACNVVALVYLIRSAWRMAGAAEFPGAGHTDRREWIAFGIGLLCSGSYILNAFAHQQTDVLIDAFVMTGCAALMEGRTFGGSVLIGLGAAFKGPPLLLAPYLVLRRQWSAAAIVVAVAPAVNFAPDLIRHAPVRNTWLQHWLQDYVLPTQRLDTALGTWGSDLIYNQSLGGTLRRLVTTALQWKPGDLSVVDRRVLVDTITLKAVAYGMMFVMLVVSIWTALRADRVAADDSRRYTLPMRTAIEFGVVLTLVLMMSPMSSKAHFGLLILPAFALSRIAVLTKRYAIWVMLALAAVGSLAGSKDLVGATVSTTLLWTGAITWSAVILWIGCIAAFVRGYAAQALPAFSSALFCREQERR